MQPLNIYGPKTIVMDVECGARIRYHVLSLNLKSATLKLTQRSGSVEKGSKLPLQCYTINELSSLASRYRQCMVHCYYKLLQ